VRLAFQAVGARMGELGRGRFRARHGEERSVDLVHRQVRRRHSRRRLEEPPSTHCVALGERRSQFLQPRLHFALLGRLRRRQVLVAGDDLGGNGRREREFLGGVEVRHFGGGGGRGGGAQDSLVRVVVL